MKVSVCMATYNRDPKILGQVLSSILCQKPPFSFEVVVVDDGSEGNPARGVCLAHSVKYHRIERPPVRRNPCIARNTAYKMARGEFLVLQSDEVVHKTKNSLRNLVFEADKINPNSFVIANVFGCGPNGKPQMEYTGLKRQMPYFFLGILRRKHLYAVGGNDEEFENFLGYDDDWFADCLIRGLRLTPVYTTSVVGYHLHHPCSASKQESIKAKEVYLKKYTQAESTGVWQSSGGPWEVTPSG